MWAGSMVGPLARVTEQVLALLFIMTHQEFVRILSYQESVGKCSDARRAKS